MSHRGVQRMQEEMARGGIMVATSTILLIMMQRLTVVGGIAAVMVQEEEVGRVQVVGCEVAEERVWAASWVRVTVG